MPVPFPAPRPAGDPTSGPVRPVSAVYERITESADKLPCAGFGSTGVTGGPVERGACLRHAGARVVHDGALPAGSVRGGGCGHCPAGAGPAPARVDPAGR